MKDDDPAASRLELLAPTAPSLLGHRRMNSGPISIWKLRLAAHRSPNLMHPARSRRVRNRSGPKHLVATSEGSGTDRLTVKKARTSTLQRANQNLAKCPPPKKRTLIGIRSRTGNGAKSTNPLTNATGLTIGEVVAAAGEEVAAVAENAAQVGASQADVGTSAVSARAAESVDLRGIARSDTAKNRPARNARGVPTVSGLRGAVDSQGATAAKVGGGNGRARKIRRANQGRPSARRSRQPVRSRRARRARFPTIWMISEPGYSSRAASRKPHHISERKNTASQQLREPRMIGVICRPMKRVARILKRPVSRP
jgi:hypothetical protein